MISKTIAIWFCCLLAWPWAMSYAGEVRIATWNLEWFFDHDLRDNDSDLAIEQSAPNEREYRSRVNQFADAIASFNPHVLALMEVENHRVVQDIATKIRSAHNLKYQVAFVQGIDSHTEQDVAFLVLDGISFTAGKFKYSRYRDSSFKDLSKHQRLNAKINGVQYTFVAVHLITDSTSRAKQAKTLREWIAPLSTGRLIVLGDLNASLAFNETTPESDIGTIRGFATSSTADDLFDCHQKLSGPQRRTHVSDRELDRILLSRSVAGADGQNIISAQTRRDLSIFGSEDFGEDPKGRGVRYDLGSDQQDLSDHFPLIVTLKQ